MSHARAFLLPSGRLALDRWLNGSVMLQIPTGANASFGYRGKWANCELVMIPKPGKVNKRPKDLRPGNSPSTQRLPAANGEPDALVDSTVCLCGRQSNR